MKLTLNTTVLVNALRLAGRRISGHPALPSGAAIQLTAHGDQAHLTASGDLALAFSTALEATVHLDGTAVLPGRMLTDIAKTLPANTLLDISVETGLAHLSFGTSRITVPVLDMDYPQMPKPARPVGTVSGRDLAAAVNQVVRSIGRDETLPSLTGIRVRLDGHHLTFDSTDRYRVTTRSIPIERSVRRAPSALCLVAGKALRATAADLKHAEAVTIGLPTAPGQLFSASAGELVFTHTALDSPTYPDLDKLTPKAFATIAVLDRTALAVAVRRAVAVAGESVPVYLTVQPGGPVVLSGGSRYEGRTRDELDPRSVKGDPVTIAVNPVFVLDVLHTLNSRTIQLGLNGPEKPVVLGTPGAERGAARCLVMPVRPYSDAPMPH